MNFDDWKNKLETFLAKSLDANEIAWARHLYEHNYTPWNAYMAYCRLAMVSL